jgi:hypothetical protein
MDKYETIKNHLTLINVKAEDGFIHYSTLCGALRDARTMTGRNIETGTKDDSNKCGYLGSWLGAMGYITILDQIGKCYRPSKKEPLEKNMPGIKKVLNYYSELTEPEINAIYALRNAFFHDFSLFNNDRSNYIHQFIVDNHSTNPVVILPMTNWDGKIDNINKDNATYINLQALGDLVESIYKKLLELSKINALEIELEEKEDELAIRYLVVTG